MKLHMPTLVYMETGCVKKHINEAAKLGGKALIVTGRHSSRINGSLNDIVCGLTGLNAEYCIFDDIEENPSVETVMRARDYGIREKADYVIGVGGGSPLDAAKAIALMIANPECDGGILYGDYSSSPYDTPKKALPVAAVPTTAGTGSEVTPYSILTIHEKRTKKSISHRIFPDIAMIDASYLRTQTPEGMAYTAADTLAHLIESRLNSYTDRMSEIYSERGLMEWSKVKNCLKNAEFDTSDYENLMYASMLGGMAISHTGTGIPHGLSYMATYELGEPHGKAVGRHLCDFMRRYYKNDADEVKKVLGYLEFDTIDELEDYLKCILKYEPLSDEFNRKNLESVTGNAVKMKSYPFDVY